MTIDTNNLNDVVKNVVLSKTCSIKPHKDSDESKTITLNVRFNQVVLRAVFEKAVSGTVISWANSKGRKNYDLLNDKQVVEVDFQAPAAQIKTREELINEYKAAFRKAGLPAEQAEELAIKAVDNPEVID